jgi:UDP-N-acetylmuramate dehydrogenase
LVLVNDGGATLDEVLAVAANISGDVREAFGVELEIEPVRWA